MPLTVNCHALLILGERDMLTPTRSDPRKVAACAAGC